MADRTWRADPPARPKRYDWDGITKELRRRPGKWMLIDSAASISLAGAITRQKMTALRSDTWDYAVRTLNNDHVKRTAEVWMSATRKEAKHGE